MTFEQIFEQILHLSHTPRICNNPPAPPSSLASENSLSRNNIPNRTDFPPSPISEAELDLYYLHEGSCHTSASFLPLPIEDSDVLGLENLKTGDVVLDREGVE